MVKRLEKFQAFDGTIFNDETTAEEYESGLYNQWLKLRGIAGFAAVIDTGDGDFGMDVRERVLQDLIRYEFSEGLHHVPNARVALDPAETSAETSAEEKTNQPRILEPTPREEPKFEVGKH